MAAMSAKGPEVMDSEEAEVLACRRALEFAVDAGFEGLMVEGDNSTVIRCISSLRAYGPGWGIFMQTSTY